MEDKKTPRGIRNKNPLNIRKGSQWLGLASQQDREFCTFIDMEWGVRAAVKIIRSYARRGIHTVAEIIQTWAPPIENNTNRYIQVVCSRTGFLPTHTINIYDENEMVALLMAMSFVEVATVLDEKIFRKGYNLANMY